MPKNITGSSQTAIRLSIEVPETGDTSSATRQENAIQALLNNDATISGRITAAYISGLLQGLTGWIARGELANDIIDATKLSAATGSVGQYLQLQASNGLIWNTPISVQTGTGLDGADTAVSEGTVTISIENAGVDTAQLADNAVETAKINNGSVTASKLSASTGAGTIGKFLQLQSGNALSWETAGGAVITLTTGTGLDGADSGVSSGSVTISIENGGVDTAQLADAAVTAAKLAANAVITSKISDGQVTAAKLASNAVTNAKVADNAIGTSEIINGAVTRAKIIDDAVDASKLSAATGTVGQILKLAASNGLEWDDEPTGGGAGSSVLTWAPALSISVTHQTGTFPSLSRRNFAAYKIGSIVFISGAVRFNTTGGSTATDIGATFGFPSGGAFTGTGGDFPIIVQDGSIGRYGNLNISSSGLRISTDFNIGASSVKTIPFNGWYRTSS